MIEFSDYEIIEKLSDGECGTVYRARHKTNNTEVALKVIHKHLAPSEDIQDRFLDEAFLLSTLNHPNVLNIQEYFQENDQLAVTTEVLQGNSLRHLLDSRTDILLGDGLDWMVQMLRGIAHAHERGVVHGNLKPSNVFITTAGEVKIMDFGLTKELEVSSQMTSTGQMAGTPIYLPPETFWLQNKVSLQEVGIKGDIFSFGIIAYRIFSEQLPYGLHEGMAPSEIFTQLAVRYNAKEPIAPLITICPDLPREIADVVMQCLFMDPGFRPSTVDGLLQELEGVDSLAPPPPDHPVPSVPVPSSVPQPISPTTPVPVPKPTPVPAPMPVAAPEPTPQATPVPVPKPTPVPALMPVAAPEPLPQAPVPEPVSAPPPLVVSVPESAPAPDVIVVPESSPQTIEEPVATASQADQEHLDPSEQETVVASDLAINSLLNNSDIVSSAAALTAPETQPEEEDDDPDATPVFASLPPVDPPQEEMSTSALMSNPELGLDEETRPGEPIPSLLQAQIKQDESSPGEALNTSAAASMSAGDPQTVKTDSEPIPTHEWVPVPEIKEEPPGSSIHDAPIVPSPSSPAPQPIASPSRIPDSHSPALQSAAAKGAPASAPPKGKSPLEPLLVKVQEILATKQNRLVIGAGVGAFLIFIIVLVLVMGESSPLEDQIEACEAGDSDACLKLGKLYENDEKNAMKAYEGYRSACDGGNLKGCIILAEKFLTGGKGITANAGEALSLFEKACQGGELQACIRAGKLVMEGPKSPDRAMKSYDKACSGEQLEGCYLLAELLSSGGGLKNKKTKKASLFYEKACAGGVMKACVGLGEIYLVGHADDQRRAVDFFKQACDADEQKGCVLWGAALTEGWGIKKDHKRAANLLKAACNTDNQDGCYYLGSMHVKGKGVVKNYDEALRLFENACEEGSILGCVGLGELYAGGVGVAQANPEKAVSLFKKACKENCWQGCDSLGLAYRYGNGVRKDRKQAEALFSKACKAGLASACLNQKKMRWAVDGTSGTATEAAANSKLSFDDLNRLMANDAPKKKYGNTANQPANNTAPKPAAKRKKKKNKANFIKSDPFSQ